MKSICVYLGANCGNNIAFSEAVIHLGEKIAETGSTLIYGRSSLGLMGLLANTVIENGLDRRCDHCHFIKPTLQGRFLVQ